MHDIAVDVIFHCTMFNNNNNNNNTDNNNNNNNNKLLCSHISKKHIDNTTAKHK